MRHCFLALVALSMIVSRGFAAGEVVRATGTLQPSEIVDVSAQVAGVVQSLGADYSALVKKGDVLARIDSAKAEVAVVGAKAELERAQAGLAVARAKFELAEQMAKHSTEKAAGQADWDIAKSQLDVAKAEVQAAEAGINVAKVAVDRAQLALDNCTMRAPADGRVLDRRVNVGQAVAAGGPSAFLIQKDPDKLQLWANVSEADIGRVAVGQPVRFTVDALPGKSFTGKITQLRLNSVMTRNVVTYTAVINVSTPEETLLPFMTAHAEITTAEKSEPASTR